MVKICLLLCVCLSGVQSEEQDDQGTKNKNYELGDFNKQFYWLKPPNGMFEVNTGLYQTYKGLNLEDQQLI